MNVSYLNKEVFVWGNICFKSMKTWYGYSDKSRKQESLFRTCLVLVFENVSDLNTTLYFQVFSINIFTIVGIKKSSLTFSNE